MPKKGFTLIELLIVITIIGILAVALVPRISQGPARARDTQRKADMSNIASSLELYYSDTGAYPVETDGCFESGVAFTAINGYIDGGAPSAPPGAVAAVGAPKDCLGIGGSDYYYYTGTAAGYTIAASMETMATTTGFFCDGLVVGTDECVAGDDNDGVYYVINR